jgi:hypothetical protein
VDERRSQGNNFGFALTTEWKYFSFSTPAGIADDGTGTVYFRWFRGAVSHNIPAGLRIDFAAVNLERGGFPTSYIPTSGSTVTRAADVASITGSNFSSWYNSTEGTVLFNAALGESVNGTPSIVFGNYQWATNPNAWRTSGNQTIMGSSSSRTTRKKHAFGLKANDHAVSINGAAASGAIGNNNTSPASSGPVSFNGNGNTLNGHISRLTYWPVRLTNAQLQEITT